MMQSCDIKEIVNKQRKNLSNLPLHVLEWFDQHYAHPRKMSIYSDSAMNNTVEVWIITESTGENDSSYQVVYNNELELFGLTARLLPDGKMYLLGYYGSLGDAVQGM